MSSNCHRLEKYTEIWSNFKFPLMSRSRLWLLSGSSIRILPWQCTQSKNLKNQWQRFKSPAVGPAGQNLTQRLRVCLASESGLDSSRWPSCFHALLFSWAHELGWISHFIVVIRVRSDSQDDAGVIIRFEFCNFDTTLQVHLALTRSKVLFWNPSSILAPSSN